MKTIKQSQDLAYGDVVEMRETNSKRKVAKVENIGVGVSEITLSRGFKFAINHDVAVVVHVKKELSIPTWNECSRKIDNNEQLTAIELFIYNNEPGGKSEIWRTELINALNETTK